MEITLNSPKYADTRSLAYQMHKKQQDRKKRKNFTPELFERYLRRNEGTTDYATIPTVTLAGDFVIEFDLSTTSITNSAILGSASSIDITMLSTGFVRIADGVAAVTSNIIVNDGVIHRVKLARVSGLVSFYVDGVPAGSGVAAASLTFEQMYRDVTTNYLSGILANLKIWDNGTLIRDYPLDDNSTDLRELVSGQNGTGVNFTPDQWGLFQQQATGEWLGQELWDNSASIFFGSQEQSTIDNGSYTVATTGNGTGIQNGSITQLAGRDYSVSLNVTDISSGNINYSDFTSNIAQSLGVNSLTVSPTADRTIYIKRQATELTSVSFDNVSVKEVLNVA